MRASALALRGDFNPRPREEGDSGCSDFRKVPRDFNPRPREEGDCFVPKSLPIFATISIHALVKRATKTRAKKEPPVDISIHALVKRATKQGL